MYALSHKPVPTPALAGSGPPSERGVVLLVALIILVALTLAGVALIRSVDTANIIAGNLSFRESAVHAGERSTQMAIDGLRTMALEDPILLHNDRAGNGYFATRDDPPVGTSWETFWETTLENQAVVTARDGSTPACPDPPNPARDADDAGNTVCYVIHRLCGGPGAPHIANCAKSPAGTNVGGSFSAGGPAQIASNQVYYRITTRITGPRNTVAYLQTIVLR